MKKSTIKTLFIILAIGLFVIPIVGLVFLSLISLIKYIIRFSSYLFIKHHSVFAANSSNAMFYHIFIWGFLFLIVIGGFISYVKFIQPKLDSLMDSKSPDRQKEMLSFITKLPIFQNIEESMKDFFDVLERLFMISKASIILKDNNEDTFVIYSNTAQPEIIKDFNIDWLQNLSLEVYSLSNIKNISEQGNIFLKEHNFKYICPLKNDHMIIGILCFDGQSNIFLKDDFNFIKTIAYNLTISFMNIWLFKYITLQKKLIKSEKEKSIVEQKEKNIKELTQFYMHEVKNTVFAVSGSVKLFQSNKIKSTQMQEQALNNIQSICNRLVNYSQRYLYLEEMSLGLIQFCKNKINLLEIIKEAVIINDHYIKDKLINMEIEIDKKLEFIADKESIITLFYNLINNAVKYSNLRQPVEITAKEENNNLFIKIKDNGCGIPNIIKEKLFKKFVKSADKSNYTISTGLGLAICHQIVDKYNGTINFTSEEGRGTEFIIQLPKLQITENKLEFKTQRQ